MKFVARVGTLGLALIAILSLAACNGPAPANAAKEIQTTTAPASGRHMQMSVPENLDTSMTRSSDLGAFKVSYQSSQPTPTINELFSWTIHIETGAGTPVESAEIEIRTSMPQHGHGMPTVPQVTQDLGDGDYLVEGLKYSMPGWWEITFDITADGKNDPVTFNMVLK